MSEKRNNIVGMADRDHVDTSHEFSDIFNHKKNDRDPWELVKGIIVFVGLGLIVYVCWRILLTF